MRTLKGRANGCSVCQEFFRLILCFFMEKLLMLIVAVSINSYYILVSVSIALRAGFVFLWQHVYSCICALLLGTSICQYLSAGR